MNLPTPPDRQRDPASCRAKACVRRSAARQSGLAAIEYALIASLIAMAIVVGVSELSSATGGIYQRISAAVGEAVGGPAGASPGNSPPGSGSGSRPAGGGPGKGLGGGGGTGGGAGAGGGKPPQTPGGRPRR
jgi:Flp pilus assembly pilin Flp